MGEDSDDHLFTTFYPLKEPVATHPLMAGAMVGCSDQTKIKNTYCV
jgi:hypothetical protein